MGILTKSEIKKFIIDEDMVTGYGSIESQLQPNGFDLRLDEIFEFNSRGMISPKEKTLPEYNKVPIDKLGDYILIHGNYLFSIMETIKLPKDVCAFTVQRSSVMRSGVIANVGWWDSGYNGKGFSQLLVNNYYGFIVRRTTPIIQIIFMENTSETDEYKGQYQYEGVKQ